MSLEVFKNKNELDDDKLEVPTIIRNLITKFNTDPKSLSSVDYKMLSNYFSSRFEDDEDRNKNLSKNYVVEEEGDKIVN